jgi:hypothetical protein
MKTALQTTLRRLLGLSRASLHSRPVHIPGTTLTTDGEDLSEAQEFRPSPAEPDAAHVRPPRV